ncbi:DNA repair protein RecO [Edaphobacillus lindanitolerans]|uniref:DNA repair protein RecO n=1 Tax=Edaphobacillus lindanitolerans TaxID=550447 RepID=A0A1U7PQ04_9BACI|nr:DNA repair protein RecO [Edaphobacillus lindanitolerans]SIT82282.1 DNA replication and repair protein RecO [Edaphobacillus lindanitolerans]
MLNKWEGIILRTGPYGESNKVVTMLTREAGKISAMARGAKKPASRLAGVTQPFTHGLYLVRSGRGMGTLQSGDPLEPMRFLHQDITAAAYASYIAELMDRLVEDGRPAPAEFGLLLQAFHAINEEYDPEAITLFVEWKMLPVAGVYPVLHQCANCGATEGEFAYSFRENGFLCHRCFELDRHLVRLSPAQVRLIRTFYTVPIEQVGKLTLKPATKAFMRKLVRTIYDEQVGIRLKSAAFLDQLSRMPEFRRDAPAAEDEPETESSEQEPQGGEE